MERYNPPPKKSGVFLHLLFNGCNSKLFPNAGVSPSPPGHGVVLDPFSILVEFFLDGHIII